mmetsp:Transcript_37302/g.109319  ORF Transcript_37302/g.109319 Transcript_37302/m.109319 type:complete len:87 (-) Transcript_37302:66-326(-)
MCARERLPARPRRSVVPSLHQQDPVHLLSVHLCSDCSVLIRHHAIPCCCYLSLSLYIPAGRRQPAACLFVWRLATRALQRSHARAS